MVRRALVVLCFAFTTVFMASCGQTYHLVSISATPSTGYNLEVPGQTGAITVTATYSNTKTNVVTVSSKYQIAASSNPSAPLSVNGVPALTVNQSGVVQASGSAGVCTWTAAIPTGSTTYAYTSAPYTVNVTYTDSGVTVSSSVPISVATAANCYDGQAYPHPVPAP